MTIYRVYKKSRPITLKEVINVFDLGYLLGVEKDFPEQPSSTPIIESREIWNYLQKKKSITKIILEKRY